MSDLSVTIPEFVLQEAREKIFENDVLGLKEYEAEKKKIVDAEFEKIDEEYESKLKLKDQEYKIQKSNSINASRLLKM